MMIGVWPNGTESMSALRSIFDSDAQTFSA